MTFSFFKWLITLNDHVLSGKAVLLPAYSGKEVQYLMPNNPISNVHQSITNLLINFNSSKKQGPTYVKNYSTWKFALHVTFAFVILWWWCHMRTWLDQPAFRVCYHLPSWFRCHGWPKSSKYETGVRTWYFFSNWVKNKTKIKNIIYMSLMKTSRGNKPNYY